MQVMYICCFSVWIPTTRESWRWMRLMKTLRSFGLPLSCLVCWKSCGHQLRLIVSTQYYPRGFVVLYTLGGWPWDCCTINSHGIPNVFFYMSLLLAGDTCLNLSTLRDENLRLTWDRAWFWTSSCGTKQRTTSFLVHRREWLAYVIKKSRIGFFIIKSIPINVRTKEKHIYIIYINLFINSEDNAFFSFCGHPLKWTILHVPWGPGV